MEDSNPRPSSHHQCIVYHMSCDECDKDHTGEKQQPAYTWQKEHLSTQKRGTLTAMGEHCRDAATAFLLTTDGNSRSHLCIHWVTPEERSWWHQKSSQVSLHWAAILVMDYRLQGNVDMSWGPQKPLDRSLFHHVRKRLVFEDSQKLTETSTPVTLKWKCLFICMAT